MTPMTNSPGASESLVSATVTTPPPLKLPPPILITGCGSSGTTWISAVLYRAGVRVGHEHIHRDGMASWYAAAGEKDPRNKRWFELWLNGRGGAYDCKLRDFKRPPVIFHQVRHPLRTMSTFQRAARQSWRLVNVVFNAYDIEFNMEWPVAYRCMIYWLRWNELAARIASWRYRIENIEKVWPEFCQRISRPWLVNFKSELQKRDKGSNSQRQSYSPLSWRQLRKFDKRLVNEIIERGHEYGYRI